MRWTIAICVLAACGSSGDDYQAPPGGGSGVDGGHTGGDGGPQLTDAHPADASGDFLSGRVCHVTDLRSWNCVDGVEGATVTLGAASVVTGPGGEFSITNFGGDVWHASLAGNVTTLMPFDGTTLIPVVTVARYTQLLGENSASTVDTSYGSVVGRVTMATVPMDHAVVNQTPQFGPFYEGAGAETWTGTETGASGVVWLVGLAQGHLPLPIAHAATVKIDDVPIEQGAITFAQLPI